MKLCCIRDDDVHAFTTPENLQRAHAPLFARGLAINFATIPAVRGDTRLRADDIYRLREGLEHHPFLPPEQRGNAQAMELGSNAALCRFLRTQPRTEILQHGYDHGLDGWRREGEEPNAGVFERRVLAGRRLLTAALGAAPRFYVPPWDAFRTSSLRVLKRQFDGVSVRALGLSHLPVWQRWRYLRFRREGRSAFFWGRFLILEHPGYLASRFDGENLAARVHALLDRLDVLVLVQHHWECLWPGEDRPGGLLERWHALIEDLATSGRVEFVTMSELRSRLRRRRPCT